MISVYFKVCGFLSVSAPLPAYSVSISPSKSGTTPRWLCIQYSIKKTLCQEEFSPGQPLSEFTHWHFRGNRLFFPGRSQAGGIPRWIWCSLQAAQSPCRLHFFLPQGHSVFSKTKFPFCLYRLFQSIPFRGSVIQKIYLKKKRCKNSVSLFTEVERKSDPRSTKTEWTVLPANRRRFPEQ